MVVTEVRAPVSSGRVDRICHFYKYKVISCYSYCFATESAVFRLFASNFSSSSSSFYSSSEENNSEKSFVHRFLLYSGVWHLICQQSRVVMRHCLEIFTNIDAGTEVGSPLLLWAGPVVRFAQKR